jgi:DNA polymerase-3 subunit beta
LALATTDDPEGASALHDIARGVIVPRKCVLEIARMVDQVDGEVQIAMSGSKIRFELGRMTYVSKLIDGTFPDYQRIIPTDNDSVVLVDAEELAKGIDRVSTIATEKTRAVKVSVERNRLTLSVNSPDNGLATEEIEIEYGGKPIEIGFNSRYFLDALNLIKGGRVELAMKDAAAPVIMRKEGDAHNIGIIMPMRV